MAARRHTPGTWSVFRDDSGGQWTGWPLSITSDEDEDKSVVRPGGFYPYKWDSSMSQDEAVANAVLMAASPEMLKALDAVLPLLEAAAAGGDQRAKAAVELARSTITKATQVPPLISR